MATLIQQGQIKGEDGHQSLEQQLESITKRLETLEKENDELKQQIETLAGKTGQTLSWGAKEW